MLGAVIKDAEKLPKGEIERMEKLGARAGVERYGPGLFTLCGKLDLF
jgi:hypothetical protein